MLLRHQAFEAAVLELVATVAKSPSETSSTTISWTSPTVAKRGPLDPVSVAPTGSAPP
jgi:hypothetical protein